MSFSLFSNNYRFSSDMIHCMNCVWPVTVCPNTSIRQSFPTHTQIPTIIGISYRKKILINNLKTISHLLKSRESIEGTESRESTERIEIVSIVCNCWIMFLLVQECFAKARQYWQGFDAGSLLTGSKDLTIRRTRRVLNQKKPVIVGEEKKKTDYEI